MKKKVLVTIPERLLYQIDLLAKTRCQTRSELIREALRIHAERLACNPGVPMIGTGAIGLPLPPATESAS